MNKNNSNIMPLSNVYVLRGDFHDDKEFQSRVRGYSNLREMLIQLAGLGHFRGGVSLEPYLHMLTPVQRREYELGMYCALQEDKDDLVWGLARREDQYEIECRCYHVNCKYFRECRSDFDPDEQELVIVRPRNWSMRESETGHHVDTYKPVDQANEKTKEKTTGDRDGKERGTDGTTIIFDDDPNVPDELSPLDITEKDFLPENGTEVYYGQDAVINGGPEENMLVLAGPGTGKTHCLIEKIKHMVEVEGSIEVGSILLLCFTRAAVKEIKERLARTVETGDYSDDLSRMEIRTFDSFATLVLIERGVDVTGRDYDERIEMAINEIKADHEILNEMRHFIVDEIQDLVGVRARLVQTILDCRPPGCGFTLLGDHLQGIYDYQVRDIPGELDAKGLFEWIREKFAGNLTVVGLNENRRQSDNLADYSIRARRLLDSGKVDNALKFINTVKTIPTCGREYGFHIPGNENGRTAVLCRNNGEVLKLSCYLRRLGIEHTVRRKVNFPLLPVWVADLLNNDNTRVTPEFLERLNGDGRLWRHEDTERIYHALDSLVPGSRGGPRLSDVKNALANGSRLPDEIYEQRDIGICVSTIHQSKGREYESVIILKPGELTEEEDIFEEAKVYYVAVTRAKTMLHTIERTGSRNRLTKKYCNSGRWVELGYRPGGRKTLVAVEVGIDGDIDEQSFVDAGMLSNPDENQEYIRNVVSPGDPVELRRVDENGGYYEIIHGGRTLGKMSDYFFRDVKNVMYELYRRPRHLPRSFEEVYVDRVYTVVKKPETIRAGVGQPWNSSGVWCAVSVLGMGLVRWGFEYQGG
jgi:hypothetical protein